MSHKESIYLLDLQYVLLFIARRILWQSRDKSLNQAWVNAFINLLYQTGIIRLTYQRWWFFSLTLKAERLIQHCCHCIGTTIIRLESSPSYFMMIEYHGNYCRTSDQLGHEQPLCANLLTMFGLCLAAHIKPWIEKMIITATGIKYAAMISVAL